MCAIWQRLRHSIAGMSSPRQFSRVPFRRIGSLARFGGGAWRFPQLDSVCLTQQLTRLLSATLRRGRGDSPSKPGGGGGLEEQWVPMELPV